MTKRICVTGASGRAGRVTVRELLEHGYQVVATDRMMPADDLGVRPLLADCAALGFVPQHSWREHVTPGSS
jgi:nucleoside-diphosphate-sugar epimerase